MPEVKNCPNCGALYMENAFREVCDKCHKDEEKLFNEVYTFLRKRENRAATQERIIEVTGVKEETLYRWIKKGRLSTKIFPNLGYPCDKCGKIISSGKICDSCLNELSSDLKAFETQQQWNERNRDTVVSAYHSLNSKK